LQQKNIFFSETVFKVTNNLVKELIIKIIILLMAPLITNWHNRFCALMNSALLFYRIMVFCIRQLHSHFLWL